MKAMKWVKKLGVKLLGKKANSPADDIYSGGLANLTAGTSKKKSPLVLDGLGAIQLPEHWRN